MPVCRDCDYEWDTEFEGRRCPVCKDVEWEPLESGSTIPSWKYKNVDHNMKPRNINFQ